MTATPDHYALVLDSSPVDNESVTYVVVAGATMDFVAATLGVDLSRPQEPGFGDDTDASAYALGEIPGGVVALETTGYADPSNEALTRLSADGRRAAVVRSNIQGHTRFGCAQDGVLVFDDDEYTFIEAEDRGRVPAELRGLFDLAWVDLDDEDAEPEADELAVAMAMVEVATGLELTAEDLEGAVAGGFFRAPMLVYVR